MKSLLKWEHTQGSETGALKGELRTPGSGFLSFLDSCQLEGGIFITWGGDFLGSRVLCFFFLTWSGFLALSWACLVWSSFMWLCLGRAAGTGLHLPDSAP